MPKKLVALLVLSNCCPLRFLDININSAFSQVKCDCDPLKSLEGEVAIRVGFQLEGDDSLILLLGIENVESEGHIGFLPRAVVIPHCI